MIILCRCSLVVKHAIGNDETVGPIPTSGSKTELKIWWNFFAFRSVIIDERVVITRKRGSGPRVRSIPLGLK